MAKKLIPVTPMPTLPIESRTAAGGRSFPTCWGLSLESVRDFVLDIEVCTLPIRFIFNELPWTRKKLHPSGRQISSQTAEPPQDLWKRTDKIMTTYTTTANGTYTDCGLGQPVGLTLTCGGPSCEILNSFPNLRCQQDTASTTTSCSNGVTCPFQPNFVSQFEVAQSADNTVKTSQDLTIDEEGFTGTDADGVVAFTADNGPQPNPPNVSPTVVTYTIQGTGTTGTGGGGPPPETGTSGTQTSIVVVTIGAKPTGSSSSPVSLQPASLSFKPLVPKTLLTFFFILSILVAEIQCIQFLSPGDRRAYLAAGSFLTITQFLNSLLLTNAQGLVPNGPCPPGGGTFCAGIF